MTNFIIAMMRAESHGMIPGYLFHGQASLDHILAARRQKDICLEDAN